MKRYHLVLSLLAVVGVSLVFQNYPVVVGILSFGIAIGYKEIL
jgi:energy-converting hydrogenase Eha subunit E